MPNANYLVDQWLPSCKQVVKVTAKIDEEDYELIRRLFPELGVSTYLPALAFRVLADAIRAEGITDIDQRWSNKNFVSTGDIKERFKYVRESTSS